MCKIHKIHICITLLKAFRNLEEILICSSDEYCCRSPQQDSSSEDTVGNETDKAFAVRKLKV